MANEDKKNVKVTGRAGENTLNLLGTVANLAGSIFLGPELGPAIAAPFLAGSQMLSQRRQEKNLIELLKSIPQTAPVVDLGEGIASSGGLPSLLNSLQGQTSPSFISPVNPSAPATNLPNALPPIQPTSTTPSLPLPQTQAAAPAQKEPSFLETAARLGILTPAGAEKLVLSQVEDPSKKIQEQLGLIRTMQQIQGFETPEAKRAARLAEKEFFSSLNEQNIRERQKIASQDRLEAQIIKQSQDPLNKIDTALGGATALQSLFDDVVTPALAEGLALSTQPINAIYQRTGRGKELSNVQAAINALLQQRLRAQEGARSSDQDRAFFKTIVPQLADTPEVFQAKLNNMIAEMRYNRYSIALNAVNATGSSNIAKSMGFTEQQMLVFNELKQRVNSKSPSEVAILHRDPTIQKMRAFLGLPYTSLGTRNAR